MQRTATVLGEFKSPTGQPERWLSVSANSELGLDLAMEAAERKGWSPIPLYRGFDPATGWPSAWMSKPLSQNEGSQTDSSQPAGDRPK